MGLARWPWMTVLVVLTCFSSARCEEIKEIQVPLGGDIRFNLPGYDACGQFTLLDPQLKPVIIVQGPIFPSIIGQYQGRANIRDTDKGYDLTISQASTFDTGYYTLSASSGKTKGCAALMFRVVVQVSSTLADVTSGTWGEWSACRKSCDPTSSQSRTRNCDVSGACATHDTLNETRTCDQAEHCPRWTEWGNWSNCSAKCGKGFRIRKRVCVNGESALLKSADCTGAATQSILCMTVCEVVGYWDPRTAWGNCSVDCGGGTRNVQNTSLYKHYLHISVVGYWDPWTTWGNCSAECGGGTRNRTRHCVSDSRVTRTSCDGDSDESQPCNETPCHALNETDPGSITTIVTGVVDTRNTSTVIAEAGSEPLNLAVVIIVSVIAGIVLIVVLVVLLRKRCAENKAVDAIAVKRPTRGRRKHKTSTDSTGGGGGGTQREDQGPVSKNVYSELSSSFVYPASEFDSVFLDEGGSGSAGTQSVHVPTLENIAEGDDEEEEEAAADNEAYTGDVDNVDVDGNRRELEDVNCANENWANKMEEAQGRLGNNDMLYVVPPEENYSKSPSNIPTIRLDIDTVSEEGSVYYEPPETPKSMSKKISTVSAVSVKYAQPGDVDRARKESVYENISDVERDAVDDDVFNADIHVTSSPGYNKLADIRKISGQSASDDGECFKIQNETDQQSEIARQKEWEALNDEHIYVNYSDFPRNCDCVDDDPDRIYEEAT